MKILLHRTEEDSYHSTGWAIHHISSSRGGYCGWLLHSSGAKIRTSDLNYHTDRCWCGRESDQKLDPVGNGMEDFFKVNKVPIARLSTADKRSINASLKQFVFSSLRPYEILNEPFLKDVITNAMAVGAHHGKNGTFRFSLTGENSLISGDSARKALSVHYEALVAY